MSFTLIHQAICKSLLCLDNEKVKECLVHGLENCRNVIIDSRLPAKALCWYAQESWLSTPMTQNDLQRYEVRIKSLQAHSEQQSKVLKRKTEEVRTLMVYMYH